MMTDEGEAIKQPLCPPTSLQTDASVPLEPGDVHTTLSSTHSEGSGGRFVFIQTKETRPFRRTELSLLIFHWTHSHHVWFEVTLFFLFVSLFIRDAVTSVCSSTVEG